MLNEKGVDTSSQTNTEMLELRRRLETLIGRDESKQIPSEEIEEHWSLIAECDTAIATHRDAEKKMTEDLWGHLVAACESIARRAKWDKSDSKWSEIREILLRASTDSIPEPDGRDDDDSWPAWGWPSPRLDAACGLVWLCFRLECADEETKSALRKLIRDPNRALRFNLADRLAILEKSAPELMWELIDMVIEEEEKFSVLDILVRSLDFLWTNHAAELTERLPRIAARANGAPPSADIHKSLVETHLFQYLRTGDQNLKRYVWNQIEECETEAAANSLLHQLHQCRDGGWLTAGDGIEADSYADEVRSRTLEFFTDLLSAAQVRLKSAREEWNPAQGAEKTESEDLNEIQKRIKQLLEIVDGIGMQLYFASGAYDEKKDGKEAGLTPEQLSRFWKESAHLFESLAEEIHPHTAHHLVETMYHLLPIAPADVFHVAATSICISADANYHRESLAVKDVVSLVQRALADHRGIFQANANGESESLVELLKVLDLFVEAGWPEARALTHRLEEIYR